MRPSGFDVLLLLLLLLLLPIVPDARGPGRSDRIEAFS
jgi:hypothetical protein